MRIPSVTVLCLALIATVQASAAQGQNRPTSRQAPVNVTNSAAAPAGACVYAGLSYTKFSAICIGRNLLLICGPPSKSDPVGSWYFDDSDRKAGCVQER